MNARSLATRLVATLLFATLLSLVAPTSAQGDVVEAMVLGETHGTRSVTRTLVDVAVAKGATGCICPGDFTYGDGSTSPAAWRDMMAPLMGQMLPAQGNHDWPWSDWSAMFPGALRYYAADVGAAQVIVLDTEYSLAAGSAQRAWLEATLAERDANALKVVALHRPWWLPDGARHPAAEFEAKNGATPAAMDALMRAYGVDLVVSAHEKNYQHSQRDGVHYLVAGGGGPEFYGIGYALPGAVKRATTNLVSTLEVGSSSMTLKTYDASGAKIEEFTMGAGAAPPPASVTFAPRNGNEWWVQVGVAGAVGRVEARDTDGAWVELPLRSWGDHAASFRVEPGHLVQYRATRADGSVVESCWYAHPTPSGCAPSFDATFRNVRGNAWWIEADVDAAGLAGVDARVNSGAWTPLAKTSWGSWAKSVRAPEGSTVELRATSSTGATDASGAYAWPPR